MKKSIIVLVKEYDYENISYSEYRNGQRIREYSYNEVQELRKTNMVVII